MTADALSLIQEHLDVLGALTLSDEHEQELPDPPDLSGLSLENGDLDRARSLLQDLAAAEERLAGMRVRVRGEIESLRRPRHEAPAPAPRVVDTSA
jgi:hypothetical protein